MLVINLGMPKMGSTSLYSYFKCGGYTSVHCVGCSGKDHYRFCSDCIEASIKDGLSPLSKCKQADSYAQIDKGPENLVQVNYLNEIVRGVPNATFILTFRNMTNWFISMTNWDNHGRYKKNMRERFERAKITGLPAGVGRNVSEFSDFYCEYVKRVRKEVAKYPGHELIEIDIEDAMVGWQMEEAFGINQTCWGKNNAGTKVVSVSVDELQR
jgi:hypothetical protein